MCRGALRALVPEVEAVVEVAEKEGVVKMVENRYVLLVSHLKVIRDVDPSFFGNPHIHEDTHVHAIIHLQKHTYTDTYLDGLENIVRVRITACAHMLVRGEMYVDEGQTEVSKGEPDRHATLVAHHVRDARGLAIGSYSSH
jgi:hypothetical protein